jgi:hypothetical protein
VRAYEQITVAGPEIVGVRLTAAADAHGPTLACTKRAWRARQLSGGRQQTCEIPIESRDEWLAAARRLA